MKKIVKKLSDLRGISGYEYQICDEVKMMFAPYADEVYTDSLGNLIAHKKSNKSDAPKILIEAHYDEIGLIVTSISEEGYIKFANVGGVDNRILPSLEVTVHGKKDIYGVVGIKPGYMFENGKNVKIDELAIDTGLASYDVKKLVNVGDAITISQSVGQLGKNQWSGKSLDDRAGVAILLSVMEKLNKSDLPVDVYAVATVQEEVGCRGAKTMAFSINPDMAIAIDVTHGITPDNSNDAFKVGNGIIISKGPNLHPILTERLVSICKEKNIMYDIEVASGDSGTDAWEIQVARYGIPTALLSIPLKYMHTSVETLGVRDLIAAEKLIYEFITNVEGDIKWLKL